MIHELKCEPRSVKGSRKVSKLRAEGKIPAVVYGEGKPATMIAIDGRTFERLLHSGDRVLTLKLEAGDQQAQIKDVQWDAFGEQMLHVDFAALKAGQKIEVFVTLQIKGVPKGQVDGGHLNVNLHEVAVKCDPTAIPEKFVIDVSELALDDAFHAGDLKLPAGVTLVTNPLEVIAACHLPRKEEEPAPAAEGVLEPEVLMEKKEEGEAGAAEGAAPGKGAAPAKGDAKDAKK